MIETARRFLVTAVTLSNWMRRLDEGGEAALVAPSVSVNRFPDFVRDVVQRLRGSFPALGKKRIGEMLARASVHLATSTVGRLLKEKPKRSSPSPETGAERGRVVTATQVHELWHVDLTVLPTVSGFWTPWFPFALLLRWPFAFWMGAVLDHVSRSVVAYKLFSSQPDAAGIVELLELARKNAGRAPVHIVTDRGPQFREEYRDWCSLHGVRPRYGALGKHGSIAVLERFWRSLKTEMLRRLRLVPTAMPVMVAEVDAYLRWYHEHRPHQGLGGKTPNEVIRGGVAARETPRLELRPNWPLSRGSPSPLVSRRVEGVLLLDARLAEGREHLPIVRVREAA